MAHGGWGRGSASAGRGAASRRRSSSSPSRRPPRGRSCSWRSWPDRSPAGCSARPPGGILAAGLVGATIVLSPTWSPQHVLPVALPTGVVTGAIGAPYLIWLLATANRDGRGG